MRNNTSDETIKRNYIQKYRFLISEYEQIKQKKHPNFRFVKYFYKAHDTNRRSFLKYYNIFLGDGVIRLLNFNMTTTMDRTFGLGKAWEPTGRKRQQAGFFFLCKQLAYL